MVQKLNPGDLGKTVIGLTGGLGSGKSTVAHFFEELGACVVDADKLAHEALMPESPVYDQIREYFEGTVGEGEEGLNRKKLAEIIFHDPEKRKKLEAVVHPYVFQRMMEEISETEEHVVLAEAPLLFESGYDQFCHQIIVVDAPRELILKRLREKGFSEEEIRARQSIQMPMEEKRKRADFIIDNSQTFQQTRLEVEKVWKKLHPASKGAA